MHKDTRDRIYLEQEKVEIEVVKKAEIGQEEVRKMKKIYPERPSQKMTDYLDHLIEASTEQGKEFIYKEENFEDYDLKERKRLEAKEQEVKVKVDAADRKKRWYQQVIFHFMHRSMNELRYIET